MREVPKKNNLLRCKSWLRIAIAIAALVSIEPAMADNETQSLEELRNTVINLLEGLVQKGVLTREQAQAMVADAQAKATAQADAQAKAKAEQAAAEKDAVRVTHVPEIVKQQLRDQLREELRPEVTKEVVAQAKEERWGVPGALPDWVSKFSFSGDFRFRVQSDMYSASNYVPDQIVDGRLVTGCYDHCYPNYQAINSAGGIGKAGIAAFLDTTVNRVRELARLRLEVDAKITDGLTAGLRMTAGNLVDPVTTNQTLGQYGARYQVGLEQAYLRYDAGDDKNNPWLSVWAGRLPNPWLSTDLVWDWDINFEGVAAKFQHRFGSHADSGAGIFATAAALPLQEIQLSPDDKWLYAGQFGFDWIGANHLSAKLAAAYYYFDHITGIKNTPDSNLLDYTAPLWLEKGNTVFDIRNSSTDTSVNLFALAAKFRLLDIVGSLSLPVGREQMTLTGDFVVNQGFDSQDIFARTGMWVEKRNKGYQAELAFGSPVTGERNTWRTGVTYRYLQSDAVLDAFTDEDLHLGGTNAKGYILRLDWWFLRHAWVTMRYLSSNEIDGPPLAIDSVQLDFNGQF